MTATSGWLYELMSCQYDCECWVAMDTLMQWACQLWAAMDALQCLYDCQCCMALDVVAGHLLVPLHGSDSQRRCIRLEKADNHLKGV